MNSPTSFLITFVVCSFDTLQLSAKDSVLAADSRHPITVNHLSHWERREIVTLVFELPNGAAAAELGAQFYRLLCQSVASAVDRRMKRNRRPGTGARPEDASVSLLEGHGVHETRSAQRGHRRGEGKEGGGGTADDVRVIWIKQELPSDFAPLHVPLIARTADGHPVSGEHLKKFIEEDRHSISSNVGLLLESVYLGHPDDQQPRAEAQIADGDGEAVTTAADDEGKDGEKPDRPMTIWEAHRFLFIAILIFIGISLILLILCCICISCRRKCRTRDAPPEQVKAAEQQPMINSPGLMQEQSSPNEPPPIDEENGWIIPLDQMTKEELEQPEVQVSRL